MKIPAGMLLAAALLFATPAATFAAPAAWGITGGVVGARMHGNYGDLFDGYRAGGAFGAHVRFTLRPWVSFQPELWWVLKGARADVNTVLGAETLSLTVDHSIPYLELPLLLRFELPSGAPIRPFVTLGPTFSMRLGGHVETDLSTGVVARAPERPVRFASIFGSVRNPWQPDYHSGDAGVVGGAGIMVGRGRVRVSAELRYERGFVDVASSDFGKGSKIGVIGGFVGFEVH